MTYKSGAVFSDSVNLGSNPSSPATGNADVSGTSGNSSPVEQPDIAEQTAHGDRTKVGTAPVRIQRKRTKGWQMPEGAVYVGRPTDLGNPFPVDVYGQAGAVDRHRRWLTGNMSTLEMSQSSTCHHGSISLVTLRQIALSLIAREQLRGKNLACWCALDQPCHADVLLEIANR